VALLPALLSGAGTRTMSAASAATNRPAPTSAAAPVAAAAKPEAASTPKALCPAAITDLPASPLFRRDDRRLQDGHLMVVRKSVRRIMVYSKGKLVTGSCLPMGLGMGGPKGPKRVEGDRKTPEGWYRTSNDPYSSWYHAISIHYPNAKDAAHGLATKKISRATYRRIIRALRRGRKPPQTTALGGLILIHGNGRRDAGDWTLGCVGMSNADIDHLRGELPRTMRAHILIVP
jgi:hypothetical protein